MNPSSPSPSPDLAQQAKAAFALMLEETVELNLAAKPPSAPGTSLEAAGDRIDRYTLMEVIGTGGMGQVWRAELTEPIRREVALKVIKPGMDSHEIIARFETERQTLALMDHPNIAAVLDAGATANGRPYFVMELVKGIPITDYCDAHHLSIRSRVELFLQVCHAVQHAHQKAVLHRDLKPSNILVTEVDGRAVPKVIDFGIAKALSASRDAVLGDTLLPTQSGTVLGTPQYMSPEQAGAAPDIDTRSDIYALGAILYELLTGCTPVSFASLKQQAIDEVLRIIREVEPARPSQRTAPITEASQTRAATRHSDPTRLTRSLSGDLDWIALNALEKDRERRYPSVTEFARDLERHLRNEPVEARPATHLYRIGKWVRRNKATFTAAALILLSLVVGLGISLWQANRANIAERLAVTRQFQAEQARDAAESSITEMVLGLRQKLLPLGKLAVMDEALNAAEHYYQKLPPALAGEASLRNQASFCINNGLIASIEGRLTEAETHIKKAQLILTQLEVTGSISEKLQHEFCMAGLVMSNIYLNNEDVEAHARNSANLRQRCDAWLKIHPDSSEALGISIHEACDSARRLGYLQHQEFAAMACMATAKRDLAKLQVINANSIDYFEGSAAVHFNQAMAGSALKWPRDTLITEFEATVTAVDAAAKLGADSSLLWLNDECLLYLALNNGGYRVMERGQDKNDKAEVARGRAMVMRAYEGRQRLLKQEPGIVQWWKDFGTSCDRVARIRLEEGDGTGAMEAMLESVRCSKQAVAMAPDRMDLGVQLATRERRLSGIRFELGDKAGLLADLLTEISAAEEKAKVGPPDAERIYQLSDRLHFAARMALKLPQIDHAQSSDLAQRACLARLHSIQLGYSNPRARELIHYVNVMFWTIAAAMGTPFEPQLASEIETMQTTLSAALAKAPDDAQLREGEREMTQFQKMMVYRRAHPEVPAAKRDKWLNNIMVEAAKDSPAL